MDWHFMQIFFTEDSLHEISNFVSKKKKEKNFKMSSVEKFTHHAKHFIVQWCFFAHHKAIFGILFNIP